MIACIRCMCDRKICHFAMTITTMEKKTPSACRNLSASANIYILYFVLNPFVYMYLYFRRVGVEDSKQPEVM